jgi:hypothetical protein
MNQNQFAPPPPGDFTLVYSNGKKFALSALILMLPALFGFLAVMILREGTNSPWIWLGIAAVAAGVAVAGILDLHKTRLDKKGDRLTYRNLLGEKSLEKSEIESFVVLQQHYVVFHAKKGAGKKDIRVSKYLTGLDQLLAWASANVRDEEMEEAKALEELALKSVEGAVTDQQRMEQVQRARKMFKALQAVTFAVVGWAWVAPFFYSYNLMVGLLALAPWAVMLFMKKYPGIVRFDGVSDRGAPRAVTPIVIATITLGLRGLQDVHILDPKPLLWMVPPLAAAMAFLLYKLDIKPNKKPAMMLLMMLFTASYFGGGLAIANALFDRSEPKYFETMVVGKRATTGRHSSYYLKVTPWGPMEEDNEISVTRSFYDSVSESQSIGIGIADGALKMPWFWYFPRR